MSSFDSWFKKKYIDLHDAILCGDLMARNYKKVSKKIYEAGQQSKQAEIDELQKRIESAMELLEYNEYVDSALQALEILKEKKLNENLRSSFRE